MPVPQPLAERQHAGRLGVALRRRPARPPCRSPTMPGTLSVPERRPRSWPPPSIWAVSRDPRLAPDVEGARRPWGRTSCGPRARPGRRWARSTSKGILPTLWTASQWKSTPAARVIGADLLDGMDHAALVVGVHDRDEDGVGAQRRLQPRRVEPAVPLHRQDGDLEAVPLQGVHRVEDRLVLGGAGDEVPPLRR